MYTGYSKLFDSMGIGNIDIGIVIMIVLILLIVLIILTVSYIVKMNRMQKKLKMFMSGKDAISLEEDIITLHEENKYLKACADRHKKDIRVLFKKAEKAFSKIGLVKYDAFHQMGGQLSFSLALLDENNNGFIINSVHSTEGCYSYTKTIKNGECELDLGKEEAEALAIAMKESTN